MTREQTADFIRLAGNGFKFNMYLLIKLPAAFFSGVRIREVDAAHCVASVPYKWLTQNPFRSTYFASLSMAAELSTGILASAHIHKRNPPVSMLVVKTEAHFYKKAVSRTYFSCYDGKALSDAVEKAISTGEGQTIITKSTGTNKEGEVIADFYITWSLKQKTSSQV